MATRFYLSEANASLNLGSQRGSVWESSPFGVTTRRLTKTKGSLATGLTTVSGVVGSGTNPNDVLFRQFISEPLAAQTISGTVTAQIRARESSLNDDANTQLAVFVVNSAGTVVATLHTGFTGGVANEYNNPSLTNRPYPPSGTANLTSYDCAAGDRIVVEFGTRMNTTRTTDTIYMEFGIGGVSDLPTGTSGTGDPWVEFSANLQYGNGATFSLNAFLKAERASSFSLDAFIFDGVRYFGLDAVLKATQSGSFALDATKRVPRSGSFTLDATIPLHVDASFGLDAALLEVAGQIIDDPFDDPATVAGTWGPNWTLIKGIENSTAEHGRNPTVGAFIYDDSNTVLDSERGGYVNRRTYLKKQMTVRAKIAQTDAPVVFDSRFAVYLRHSGETGGIGYYNATYAAVELVLLPTGYMQLQIRSNYSSIVYGPVDLTSLGTWADGDEFYIKGWIKGSRIKGKVWRVGDPEPRWQINQTGLSIPSSAGYIGMAANTDTSWKPVEWDVRRAFAYNLDFSVDLDAVLKATQAGSFALDAVRKASMSGGFSLDSVIVQDTSSSLGSFALDAVIRRGVSASLPLDAVLRSTAVRSFAVDAVLKATRSVTFPLDAVVRVSRAGSATLDANIRKTVSGLTQLDAVVLAPRTAGATLDSVLLSPRASTFSLSAAVVRRTLAAATLDAIVQRGVAGSFALDAIRRHPVAGSWALDAVLRRTSTEHFTLDSVVRRVASGSFPLDAVKFQTQFGNLTLDSIITIIRDGAPPVAVVEVGWIYAVLEPHPIQASIASESIAATIGSEPIVGVLEPLDAIGASLGWSRWTGSFTLNAEIA